MPGGITVNNIQRNQPIKMASASDKNLVTKDDIDVKNNNDKAVKPKSRRMRMPLSCVICRKRKVKVCIISADYKGFL